MTNRAQHKFAVDDIWNCLRLVPDPEIPVISIVDLGIVRNVTISDDGFEIILTPTYSGCPATAVITLDVETALAKLGVENFDVKTVISPPWTTDWISESGRKNLLDYGIAPPSQGQTCAGGMAAMRESEIACPNCSSLETKCVSPFGSTPCKAAYQCKSCLEPFDYFKPY